MILGTNHFFKVSCRKKDFQYTFTLSEMPSTGRESSRAHYWPKKIKSSAPPLIQSLLIITFSSFYVRKINKRNTIFYILGGFCTKKEKKNSCQANKVNKWITTPLIILWAVVCGPTPAHIFPLSVRSRDGSLSGGGEDLWCFP